MPEMTRIYVNIIPKYIFSPENMKDIALNCINNGDKISILMDRF